MMGHGSSTPGHPIRAVARLTGISIDTLRVWERRYAAVAPARGPRGRLYSDADVARLSQLHALVTRGHAIGAIAALPDASLRRLLDRDARLAAAPPAPAADFAPLFDALDRFDLDAIETALNRHAVVLPAPVLVQSVIVPLLNDVGRRWERGALRPSQEHLISAVIRSVLGGLLRTTARQGRAPRVVFATLTGERHELGLLCAALLAASASCGIVYLGADLPAGEIAHAAHSTQAGAIVLGATTAESVNRGEAGRLARQADGFDLWVGGGAAQALLDALGGRARVIDDLAQVTTTLAPYTA